MNEDSSMSQVSDVLASGAPLAGVETSARTEKMDVLALTVEQWVDLEPQVEIVLRRKSDGVAIHFVPTKDLYEQRVREGVVAFSPREVLTLIGARAAAGGDEAQVDALREVMAGVIAAKRALGARLGDVIDKRRSDA